MSGAPIYPPPAHPPIRPSLSHPTFGAGCAGLVHFFHATHTLLQHISPLLKFVSIKMIVFFTFWQSVAVNVLNHFGW